METSSDIFISLFTELGFVPVTGRTPVKKPKSSVAMSPQASFKRYTLFRTASSKYATWKQPENLIRLRLDTEALQEVLENGELLEGQFEGCSIYLRGRLPTCTGLLDHCFC